MQTVTSADGTRIAFDRLGGGPPLIMVVGAFNTRSTTEPLARALEGGFTVLNYDRRGRGDSGDTPPYAVDREIEDLNALIAEAGGSAAVFGYSSGATLALKAAAAGLAISNLALYEPPFVVDGSRPPLPADLPDRLVDLVASGRRGDAVELYQREAIGMPEEVVAGMRQAPFRSALEAIAHTLAYDATGRRRPDAPDRADRFYLDADARDRRRREPTFDAQRGARGRRRPAERPAPHTRRPEPRHLRRGNCSRARGVPDRLTTRPRALWTDARDQAKEVVRHPWTRFNPKKTSESSSPACRRSRSGRSPCTSSIASNRCGSHCTNTTCRSRRASPE